MRVELLAENEEPDVAERRAVQQSLKIAGHLQLLILYLHLRLLDLPFLDVDQAEYPQRTASWHKERLKLLVRHKISHFRR